MLAVMNGTMACAKSGEQVVHEHTHRFTKSMCFFFYVSGMKSGNHEDDEPIAMKLQQSIVIAQPISKLGSNI